jgi:hypothetical protein
LATFDIFDLHFQRTPFHALSIIDGEVLLFGHGKIPHFFATNNKLTPHHIKTNAHILNKIKTPNYLINQPNQSRCRHRPPPTSGEQTPPPTVFSGDFSGEKKKKRSGH